MLGFVKEMRISVEWILDGASKHQGLISVAETEISDLAFDRNFFVKEPKRCWSGALLPGKWTHLCTFKEILFALAQDSM
jgi:hypothetical protein